ncbi:Protein kinase domain-containing protein [Caenorhabditis elegans]|uniref:Protein kinase domain-containing protein n=1 Tax=Caenorhabditis elegans TaxID=6239 RepID=A0A1N7SYU5_CAEEL|nr:Protein kinase domain-containing protein [Caenorhabditis elegans]SIT60408.1 Protein kinase domain-containing protein [Caenorhabditis elegans]|eukprot:NP_001335518.1 Uncharacterized protein CELE_ZC581.9 [Caenorhabditis elegans]
MFEAIRRYSQELSMVPSRPIVSPTLSSPLQGSGAAPLEKDYHSLEYRLTHGHWRIFNSKSVFGNKDASVLVFDKKSNVKAPPKLGKSKTYSMFDLIKYETQQLMGLIHPRILHMEHSLEETKDYISFATEQIFGNLENVVTDESLDRLEIKLGVLQIIDGMSYLHNSAKMLHGNLTPDAIYVTATKTWKIGGFSFAVNAKEPNCYPCYPWTKKLPPCLQPDLDFLAPENLAPGQTTVTSAADVFSLGVLICWIYAGGKRLIDAKSNLETYHIVVGQLDAALQCISNELGPNLKDSMAKVLSLDVEVRPTVQLLSLIKHFDDPCLSALRQLDDIAQVFDPSQKSHFLSQTLNVAIPHISESVWFNRVLPRFNEQLLELPEMYYPITKPLFHILEHCESHNIHKMKPWIRKLMEAAPHNKLLRAFILENMSALFRRLSDEFVEDKCLDVIILSLKSEDTSLQSSAVRGLPHVAEYLPVGFITKKLIPAIMGLPPFLHENVPRQLDLLAALAALSDRCDVSSIVHLFGCISLCNSSHPVIVHAKSRIVQRLVMRDPNRLKDSQLLSIHLLNPLVNGLACKDLSTFSCAHFDDVLSSVRILLDVLEQRRYEMEDRQEHKQSNHHLGLNRLGNRRVSMSSTNLPRVMISAARPSFSSDSRKMSFLSADGRLEDRGSRRESRDSRGSLESDMSIRIGNGSDISDDSCFSSHSAKGRRQSWLDGYGHSVSLEQNTNGFLETTSRNLGDRNSMNFKQRNARASERRARTRSPNAELDPQREQPPARPNSFTNLGHNIVLTYRNLLYKDHT